MILDASTISISDLIQLVGILTSLVTGLIAIVISIITLRQNSKMIEEANRPIISIYTQTVNTGVPMFFLIVKNFGNSTAYMQSLTADFDFTNCFGIPKAKNFLEELGKCVIAPGQSRVCYLDYKKIESTVHFSISYKSTAKIYHEELCIDLKAAADLPVSKYTTKDKELLGISYSLQELLLKNL